MASTGTPVRSEISAKLSSTPAMIGTNVGGLGAKSGVGGYMGAACGLTVDPSLIGAAARAASEPAGHTK